MKNKIKIYRAIKNITQEQLSKDIGVSRQTINAIELNKYSPTAVLVLKMSKYFDCKVEEIFELDESDFNR